MDFTGTDPKSLRIGGRYLSFGLLFETYPQLSPDQFSELRGKHVLITGGGYGIGAGIAEQFGAAGVASVLLTGRTESKLRDTADRLAKSYTSTEFKIATLDVGSKAAIAEFFDNLTYAPDILINNAAMLPDAAPFLDDDLDKWSSCYDVNVLGVLRVTQKFLQKYRASRSEGQGPAKVISINSAVAFVFPVAGFGAYSSSKAATFRALELAAVDVPASDACFISVHPGLVKTDMGVRSKMEGWIPYTEMQLCSQFTVWCATEAAAWLHGRFVFCNWHIDDLAASKEKILEKDLLKTMLSM